MLKVKNIIMQFGGLRAIDNLSFDVNKGDIFGLIGPNGAGKTTAFNVITTNYKATSGSVIFDGKDISKSKPNLVVGQGIARTFQNIRLFPSMSVLENILIGLDASIKYSYIEAIFRAGRYFNEEKKAKEKAMELLKYMGVEQYAEQPSKSLSYGNQRKVEIARALATNPKFLMLDEPAAGMNANETDELADILQNLKKDFGLTLLLIEHDMPFVNKLCNRVLVLDSGKSLFEGTPKEAVNNPAVISAYLGDF